MLDQIDAQSFWVGIALIGVAVLVPSLSAAYRLGKVEQKIDGLERWVSDLARRFEDFVRKGG